MQGSAAVQLNLHRSPVRHALMRWPSLHLDRRGLQPVSDSRFDRGTAPGCPPVVSHDGDRIVTIGGNVGDTVKKKTVRLDRTGHLRPRRYFAVIKIENTAC